MAIAKKQRDRKALDAEIKNTLSGGIGEFELFFTEHWKTLSIAGLAIVLAIGVFYGTRNWMNSRERHAQDQLSAAQTADALDSALREYGSSAAARYARIRLARLYMESGKVKEADAQYTLLETSGLPPQMLFRVKIDRGYLLEKSGDLKKAASVLAAAAANPAAPAGLRAEAAFGAGRLYLAQKQNKEAKASLENCLRLEKTAGMDSRHWAAFAQFLMRDVK